MVEQIKADGRHEHRVHREDVSVRGANMTLSTRATATSETHHRETGRRFVGTDAPSSRGTLGGCRGNGKSHYRR